jgi:hypothetical protein
VPNAGNAPGVLVTAYARRAEVVFARLDAALAAGRDQVALAAEAGHLADLADDLASVGAPSHISEALRRLAAAVRQPAGGHPGTELTAARRAFTESRGTAGHSTPSHGEPATTGPRGDGAAGADAQPSPAPSGRRHWWRDPGR